MRCEEYRNKTLRNAPRNAATQLLVLLLLVLMFSLLLLLVKRVHRKDVISTYSQLCLCKNKKWKPNVFVFVTV